MAASKFHGAGVHFENGYQSQGLANILELVMQHQNSFVLPPDRGRRCLRFRMSLTRACKSLCEGQSRRREMHAN